MRQLRDRTFLILRENEKSSFLVNIFGEFQLTLKFIVRFVFIRLRGDEFQRRLNRLSRFLFRVSAQFTIATDQHYMESPVRFTNATL